MAEHSNAPPPYATVHPGPPFLTYGLGDRDLHLGVEFARIDYDRIAEEAADVDNEALYWAIAANHADRRAEELDLAADVTEAEVDREIRAQALARGEKPTVDDIKARRTLDARVLAAKQTYLAAKEAAADLQSAKFALVRKAERLTKLSEMVVQARMAATPPPGSLPPFPPRPARGRK